MPTGLSVLLVPPVDVPFELRLRVERGGQACLMGEPRLAAVQPRPRDSHVERVVAHGVEALDAEAAQSPALLPERVDGHEVILASPEQAGVWQKGRFATAAEPAFGKQPGEVALPEIS